MRWHLPGWHAALATPITMAVHAQAVAVHALGEPVAELTEPFSQVTGVRELRDGRVVVVDRRAGAVFLADFRWFDFPLALFDITVSLWLLFKGLRDPAAT